MSDSAANNRPLAGLRVIDIATYIAAPYCATIMAEFGAEVIKVEQPKVGDPCRRLGTVSECGDTLVWLSEARNKKSVTLNLKSPKGAAILKQLVAKADALTENFQPGTLEGWGLGWDVLSAVNPRLVMLRVSGYGQTGPYSHKPGFGRIGNAFGGISFLAGEPDGPPGDTGLGDAGRLHGRTLRRARGDDGVARARRKRPGPADRHRALRADLPHPRRDGTRL